ncbi:MAG: hypothetical protein OET81_01545 [Desulfobacteraceae bacterium]|nr:hypothetical protein [Desulfobacteraceae bacterium]MDH3572701.1 hypothetical protein [Desulfobacteraceae bacterium]MDH3722066.1 hypothetical protein [Desulfobacteraceae bacterium]MDH3872594.1 hypothetical protein [Desulfobacteraceae bacterium]MDH3882324.1 hypothetical protein [Desulfobacteraceae bacterium]
MNKKYEIFTLLIIVSFMFCASCSTTTMGTVWADKNYQGGKIKTIFVIGVSKDPTVRRVFEDEFVDQLKSLGTDAVPSYSLIPSEEMIDRPTVESKMKEVGADGVIVTTLVDRKTQKVQNTTSYYDRGYYGHYSRSYNAQYARHRTTSYEYEVFNLETNLYEIRNQKMIWSSLSDTQLPYSQPGTFSEGAVNKAIKELIKNIVKRLSESQLI